MPGSRVGRRSGCPAQVGHSVPQFGSRQAGQQTWAYRTFPGGVAAARFSFDDREPPHLLTLVCRRPRTDMPGLRASFVFDLTDPAHAGELLLVGRRGSVCIDLCALTDEPYGLDRVLLGTQCG